MSVALGLSRIIDRITSFIGRWVSWLVLAAVLVSAGNALVRKIFDNSSNAWLELQWYLYGAVFMLAAAYTLQRNEHVRIDILSGKFSKRTRDWIDLFCHVTFLVPWCVLIIYLAIPWVLSSMKTQEVSVNAGGLILWPAKLMILLGFILLLAQAISEIIKRAAVIANIIPDPYEDRDVPPAVAEMELHDDDAPGASK
ncbi:MAG: TRAP transporter small permease subunit [Nitratireductor sp.]|nr:TRAP transporter small permease subunit [Nitratireductor sp.]